MMHQVLGSTDWQTTGSVATLSGGGTNEFTTAYRDWPGECSAASYVEVIFGGGSSASSVGLAARAQSTDRQDQYDFDGNLVTSAVPFIRSWVGGTPTTIDTGASTTLINDTVKLECIGTAIKAYINAAEWASATNSDHATQSYVGFRGWKRAASAVTADNFTAQET